jgi:Tfp pilus assembly protein PilF
MSLLLDALKKAEKAKEEAQRRAKEEAVREAPAKATASEESPLIEDAQAEEVPHVRTRDQLPDISQPLEIASDDLARGDRPREGERELALESIEPPASPPPAQRQRATAARGEAGRSQAGERAAARKVFEAKMREPNPRLPFFISLGVLGAVALGTVIYFWYQLRPPPPLANANPPPAAAQLAVASSGGPSAGAVPAAGSAAPAAVASARPAAVPGLPELPAPPQAEAPRASPALAERAVPRASQRPAMSAPAVQAPRVMRNPPRDQETMSIKRPSPRLNPAIAAGYAAYQAGDLAAARSSYAQALQDEPDNRDALLGMAAVEMRAQRYGAADAHYRRLLRVDPRDPHALAGVLALRGQQIDPVLAESRVKTLLSRDTGAEVLNFTLGNEYARQGRWAEAQQAYFKALASDPGNPDFAYNLAVSLEHIGKPGLALEQYRSALALAEHRSFSFDRPAARKRIQELAH